MSAGRATAVSRTSQADRTAREAGITAARAMTAEAGETSRDILAAIDKEKAAAETKDMRENGDMEAETLALVANTTLTEASIVALRRGATSLTNSAQGVPGGVTSPY